MKNPQGFSCCPSVEPCFDDLQAIRTDELNNFSYPWLWVRLRGVLQPPGRVAFCYLDLSVKINIVEAELRGRMASPAIILLNGPSSSGKSILARVLQRRLEPQPVLTALDAFVFG